jgi:hypothetical protein
VFSQLAVKGLKSLSRSRVCTVNDSPLQMDRFLIRKKIALTERARFFRTVAAHAALSDRLFISFLFLLLLQFLDRCFIGLMRNRQYTFTQILQFEFNVNYYF